MYLLCNTKTDSYVLLEINYYKFKQLEALLQGIEGVKLIDLSKLSTNQMDAVYSRYMNQFVSMEAQCEDNGH